MPGKKPKPPIKFSKKTVKKMGAEGPKRSKPSGRMTAAQQRAADARMDAKGRITSRLFDRSIGR